MAETSKNNDTVRLDIDDVDGCCIGSDVSSKIALHDISEYLQKQNLQITDGHNDVWVVTPSRMFNKESRRLNAELGLHKINKYGQRMARYKTE